MESWQIVLISVVVPALITAGVPYLSARMKARQAARVSDAEIGSALRDELRRDRDELRGELDTAKQRIADLEAAEEECRRDRDELKARVTRLEGRLREGRDDGNLGRAGSSGGAA